MGRPSPEASPRAAAAQPARCRGGREHAQCLGRAATPRGPRRALRPPPPGARAPARGSPLPPRGKPRLPGCSWATGGAAVAQNGLGGADRRSAAGAQQPASRTAARPPPRAMAGSSSLEAVRRKIRSLQEQADAAEERAGSLQRELDYERKLRETVRSPPVTSRRLAGPSASPATRVPEAHLAHLGRLARVLGSGHARSRPFLSIALVGSKSSHGGGRGGVEKVLEAGRGLGMCAAGIPHPEEGKPLSSGRGEKRPARARGCSAWPPALPEASFWGRPGCWQQPVPTEELACVGCTL